MRRRRMVARAADRRRRDPGRFLADLARYRPGMIHCAPEVARLRLSGVFPLDDTQRILNMLPNSLPVQVRSRTRCGSASDNVAARRAKIFSHSAARFSFSGTYRVGAFFTV
jgi:hypothetical protein